MVSFNLRTGFFAIVLITNNQDTITKQNSNWTGVSRPNIDTSIFTFPRSSSTSPTLPSRSLNGPSTITTASSVSMSMLCVTLSDCMRLKSSSTSDLLSGTGKTPDPTNPVTRGVLRTTYHESSVTTISTSTYPG